MVIKTAIKGSVLVWFSEIKLKVLSFTTYHDDDIAGRHLPSGLFLGRFSGFTDLLLVFVHVKSKRCPPTF